jgi:hypothetical protein
LPPDTIVLANLYDRVKTQRRINDRHICASAAASTLYVIFATRTSPVERSTARERRGAPYDKWILLDEWSGGGNTKTDRRERSDKQKEKDW